MLSTHRNDRTVASLLDRLREEHPAEGGRDVVDFSVTPYVFIKSIERDLRWLLKTEVVWSDDDIAAVEAADADKDRNTFTAPIRANSVLAYGIPSNPGGWTEADIARHLAWMVRRAIQVEPRIDATTLRVRMVKGSEQAPGASSQGVAEFEIEADVLLRPDTQHLQLRAFYSPSFGQWRLETASYGP